MKHLVELEALGWQIDSAATESYHIGEQPHPHSQKVCREKGIDISTQRARKFSRHDFLHFDRIYAMATDVMEEMKRITGPDFDAQKVDLFLNESYPGEQRSVKDPWYGTLDGYYEVFDEIESGCQAILQRYRAT